jgi:phage-related protein
MSEYNVEFYTKSNGEKPVKEFLLELEPKMRAKMLREIKVLEDNGPKLREPDSKPLGEGIFELRAKFSNDITRVLYFFYVGKNIVLTNGFVKKTPKTPPSEIETAKKYRAEYLSRKELSK